MKYHDINNREWKEMNGEQRITALLTCGMSRKEAWELSETESVSELPGELLPLRVHKKASDYQSDRILKTVNVSTQPLHTSEIARNVPGVSDYQVKMALIRMMNEDKICGRLLDVARGVWIWWPKNAFNKAVK